MRFLRGDAGIAALLCIVCGVMATWYVVVVQQGQLGPFTGGLFTTPAVMWASGEGFHAAGPQQGTPFGDFLSGQERHLSAKEVEGYRKLALDDFQKAHRYLLYAFAVIWRLLGISYSSIVVLQVAFHMATAALAYGLFRLVAGRALSVAGTLIFMNSHAVLSQVGSPRDYEKAPFTLAALLLLGWLLKQPPGRRRYLGVAAALGLILGIGIGFRQDVMLCVPVGVLVLAGCPLDGGAWALRRRFAAITLLIGGFVLAGAPILPMEQSKELGVGQNLMRGMSAASESATRIPPGSYAFMSQHTDESLVFISASYATNALGIPHPLADDPRFNCSNHAVETHARSVYQEGFATLPADVLNRAYASILQIFRHSWGEPYEPSPGPGWSSFFRLVELPLRHFAGLWWVYAAAALVALALRDISLGLIAFCAVAFLCGYPGLQFMPRHVFHLTLLPLLMVALCWQLAASRILAARRERRLTAFWPEQVGRGQVAMAALCLVMCVAAVWLPRWATRVYQGWQMDRLLAAYQEAELSPLTFETQPGTNPGDLLHRPVGWPECRVGINDAQRGDVRMTYLAADLEIRHPHGSVGVQYTAGTNSFDLTFPNHFRIGDGPQPTRVRYFLPVYEAPRDTDDYIYWNHFDGLTLPEDGATRLLALHRVTFRPEFALMLKLALPEDLNRFEKFHRLPAD